MPLQIRVRQWFKTAGLRPAPGDRRASLEREVARPSVPNRIWTNWRHGSTSNHTTTCWRRSGAVSFRDPVGQYTGGAGAAGIRPRSRPGDPEKLKRRPLSRADGAGQVVVDGIGDLMTQMAKCCKPVPYDGSSVISPGDAASPCIAATAWWCARWMHKPRAPGGCHLGGRAAGFTFPVDIQVIAADRGAAPRYLRCSRTPKSTSRGEYPV